MQKKNVLYMHRVYFIILSLIIGFITTFQITNYSDNVIWKVTLPFIFFVWSLYKIATIGRPDPKTTPLGELIQFDIGMN